MPDVCIDKTDPVAKQTVYILNLAGISQTVHANYTKISMLIDIVYEVASYESAPTCDQYLFHKLIFFIDGTSFGMVEIDSGDPDVIVMPDRSSDQAPLERLHPALDERTGMVLQGKLSVHKVEIIDLFTLFHIHE